MKTNEKNISLKEALQLNHRAYIYLHLLLKNLQTTEALTAFVFW